MSATSNHFIETERNKAVHQTLQKGVYWCAHCHVIVSAYSDKVGAEDWHGTCGKQLEWLFAEDATPFDRVPTATEAQR